MPLMGRACRFWSPQPFSRRCHRDIAAPLHRQYARNTTSLRPLSSVAARLPRMSTTRGPPDVPERSFKRRKTLARFPQLIQPYATMAAAGNGESIKLELTEVESNLRRLLLDVATYIDDNPPNEHVTSVQVPDGVAKEKTILRWTGGWVRDKLLQVGSHDIDLAINKMTGEHFGLKMQEYLEIPGNAEKHGLVETGAHLSANEKAKKIAPGLHKIEANPEKSKNLETATTNIMGIDLDLVNLRKETYNEVSRNPQMEFGTAEEDALRRDATINAMFFNLHTCQVEDFTTRGHDDMAAKIIRTPLEPYQTFKDDPLRVLRLIRFASRLDYVIEPETAKAMGDVEIQDVLKIKISRERVGIELEKMLKGPRPRMALKLIDRFGLYRTVFTDPTRDLPAEPDTAYFQPASDLVLSLVTKTDGIPSVIPTTLLRNADEEYLAWICATVMPWADAPTVPHHKPAQRPLFVAYLVAREGFKAPNKVCDVIATSLTNTEEIRSLVAHCAKGLRRPDTIDPTNDATARDTLGMAVRRWGSTWRTQVTFNLIYEIVLGRVSKEELLRSYSVFLERLTELSILDVDSFRPLLKGTDLAKALNTKPGPWMKEALDVVMAWQLRNPDATDPTEAIEAVKAASQCDKNDSELSSHLASHFLKLTIPPFFPQNKSTTNALETARQPTPWKDPGNYFVLELLQWSIGAMDKKMTEARWHFLMPPVLRMMDDIDVGWKAKGCHMLQLLLQNLYQSTARGPPIKFSKSNQGSMDFLQRTGYHNVFADTLLPLFTYIPSLTPEQDSATLLREVFPALKSLALLLPTDMTKTNNRDRFLDKVLRDGVFAPLSHFPTPSTYPELATTIVSQFPVILTHLGIESVKHLSSTVGLLSAILQDPFALSHKPLLMSSLEGLESVVLNAWPRIPVHRGAVMMGLCLLWGRCMEDGTGAQGQDLETVKSKIRETVAMLDAVMQATEEEGLRARWESEKQDLVQASSTHGGLFEACLPKST